MSATEEKKTNTFHFGHSHDVSDQIRFISDTNTPTHMHTPLLHAFSRSISHVHSLSLSLSAVLSPTATHFPLGSQVANRRVSARARRGQHLKYIWSLTGCCYCWLAGLIRTHFTVDDCSVAARCALRIDDDAVVVVGIVTALLPWPSPRVMCFNEKYSIKAHPVKSHLVSKCIRLFFPFFFRLFSFSLFDADWALNVMRSDAFSVSFGRQKRSNGKTAPCTPCVHRRTNKQNVPVPRQERATAVCTLYTYSMGDVLVCVRAR